MRGAAPCISMDRADPAQGAMEQYDQDLDELLEEIPRARTLDCEFLPVGAYFPNGSDAKQAAVFGSPESSSFSPFYGGFKSNSPEFFNRDGSEQDSFSSASPDRALSFPDSAIGSYDDGSPEHSSFPVVSNGSSVDCDTAKNYSRRSSPNGPGFSFLGPIPHNYAEPQQLQQQQQQQQQCALQQDLQKQQYIMQQALMHYQRDELQRRQRLLYLQQQQQQQLQQEEQSLQFQQALLGAPALDRCAGVYGASRQLGNVCRYFLEGHCSRGEYCPFVHPAARHYGTRKSNEKLASFFPDKVLRRAPKQSGTPKKVVTVYAAAAAPARLASCQPETVPKVGQEYKSLEELEGRIFSIARDQHGCRFLQQKFDEGDPEEVRKIFVEIIDRVIDLMKNPFGNYLVQKLLEVCTDGQRLDILRAVKDDIIGISLSMHGTRAIQKLIETLQADEQAVTLLISSLRDGVVLLTKDSNGNHVVQRCLKRLSNEDSQFIFDAAARHCVEIATERHGCCVLQRCVDYAQGMQKEQLVAEIAANAYALSPDTYGNYVVQYVVKVMPSITKTVIARLEGRFARLAMDKFSSNVVEKCLEFASEQGRAKIIKELLSSPLLGQVLQDQFGNYVVQSALSSSKGALYTNLVEAIRPHAQALRSSAYGKRILSRTNLRK